CVFPYAGVIELLSMVVENVNEAVSRNVIGAHLLHELLSTQWLHALLQVRFQSGGGACTPALLSCHDAVAQADFGPVLAPLPDGLPVDEEVVRIVCLAKNEQPLGATIRKDKETGEIFIARVIRGGLADRSGLLHPGDLLVEVDGKPKHAPKFSVASPVPCVSPIICVTHTCSGIFILEMHAEAMVDYCPLQDSSIPCPDVGVFFSKGEVLEVLDQTDGQWWQARKITSSASFAGLIPSAATLKRSPDAITNMDRRSLSKRRRRSSTTITAYCANVATPYEEVVLYRRPPGDHHRLIILVGASGVGINELRKTLIKLNPDTYEGPIPRTRVTKQCFVSFGVYFLHTRLTPNCMYLHRFVQYGEFKGHNYGTSIDAINEVIKRGHVCIIDIEPHVGIYIRHSGNNTFKSVYVLQKQDLVDLSESSRQMEHKYKHLFDEALVNEQLSDTCAKLHAAVQRAQEDPYRGVMSWSCDTE
uniref:Membrane protein, palmitoylated 4a (MAGUK p55 subfamily member 4) n=1 Tax=Hippocampus comes TaxID=109280 RepID=A0A3Q2X9X7_HIPCM